MSKLFYSALITIISVLLYYSSKINYLIFHTIAEGICVAIGLSIFIIVYNSRKIMSNQYLQIIGLSYIFIVILDALHTLTFEGMVLFTPPYYYANQLWVGTRFFEAMVMLLGFYFINKNKTYFNYKVLLLIYSAYATVVVLSILSWHIFPECFIQGVGQTKFKIISGYIISFIFAYNLFLLTKKKSFFPTKVYKYLWWSFVFFISTEIAFTIYISNYGISNLVGHYFKLIAYYLSYKALVETAIKEPYELIFRELNEKTKQLEHSNQTKDKLFAIIGHDLKGPISAIQSSIDLISRSGNDGQNQSELLDDLLPSVKKTTSSVLNLLDNLLYWGRIQSNSLQANIENFKVDLLFEESREIFETLALQKNITLTFTIENNQTLICRSDKLMTNTILRNLINNAIKFTNRGGEINVSATIENNFIKISVQDNGIGINEDQLDKIFDKNDHFCNYGTENEKGTGLGLSLSKEFVEKLGGKIWVESTHGKGSTFHFTINAK